MSEETIDVVDEFNPNFPLEIGANGTFGLNQALAARTKGLSKQEQYLYTVGTR